MNRIQRSTTVAAAMLLATYAFTNMLGVKDAEAATQQLLTIKHFTLTVQIQGANLVVQNPASSGCNRFTGPLRNGCIVAETDEMVDVNVVLTQSPGWSLTQFRICRVANVSPAKPAGFPNVAAACAALPLSAIDMASWAVRIGSDIVNPNSNGFINLNSVQQFRLADLNLTEANYVYGIEACNGAGNCLWADPGSQNNGSSWP